MKLFLPLPHKVLICNDSDEYWSARSCAMQEASSLASCMLMFLTSYEEREHLRSIIETNPQMTLNVSVNAYPAKRGHLRKSQCCPKNKNKGLIAFKGYQEGISKALGINSNRIITTWYKFSHASREERRKNEGDIGNCGELVVTIIPFIKE